MKKPVEEIVAMEWEMFDRVQNLGGRAPCQNDRDTFFIMRSSQLAAWSPAMRESYLNDLAAAQKAGRNLLSEKYAYMMARTAPDEYARICDRLPPRTPDKERLIELICKAHVAWQEALARQYPCLAGRGRAIRKEADSAAVTSFETYLWGELATYSLDTLERYAAYVAGLAREGVSLNAMILQNMVARYGYGSVEEAEARLSGGGADITS